MGKKHPARSMIAGGVIDIGVMGAPIRSANHANQRCTNKIHAVPNVKNKTVLSAVTKPPYQ